MGATDVVPPRRVSQSLPRRSDFGWCRPRVAPTQEAAQGGGNSSSLSRETGRGWHVLVPLEAAPDYLLTSGFDSRLGVTARDMLLTVGAELHETDAGDGAAAHSAKKGQRADYIPEKQQVARGVRHESIEREERPNRDDERKPAGCGRDPGFY